MRLGGLARVEQHFIPTMDSPPKRRKISEAPYGGVGASQGLASPDRARSSGGPSFQSPTKSSLAKSHPDVLERALSRSPSRRPKSRGSQSRQSEQPQARSIGLRDRKALRPSLKPTSSPLKAPRLSGGAPIHSPSRRSSGIQAFSQPPRRLSKKIVPADFTFGSPIRQPTRPTQNLSNTPEGQLAQELGSATREAEMEVNLDSGPGDPFMDEDPLEPDLPPTPTQLGLEKAPDRPRGLLSSSPSTRHEQRINRRATDVLQGSPLKSSKFEFPSVEATDDKDVAQEISPTVFEKRRSRKRLTAELQRLKQDVAELGDWTAKVESHASLDADSKELNKFLALLSEESSHLERKGPRPVPPSISSLLSTLLPFSGKIHHSKGEVSPLPTNPFALKESSQSPSYLTVFAPLLLRAHTSRTSTEASGLLETHTLTFTPPPPFPSSLYNVSVVYETDPETQSVTSLSVPTGRDTKKRKVPETLRRWIDSRLANPLLRLDVATLCWGINRYWEVSVARGQLWAQIEHRHSSGGSYGGKDAFPQTKDGAITTSQVRRLIPHLERGTMLVKPKISKTEPQVLLSNVLTIDEWTGEPQLRSELSVSLSGGNGASSKKINNEAKKLFHALLREGGPPTAQGTAGTVQTDTIIRATEGVLGALAGSI